MWVGVLGYVQRRQKVTAPEEGLDCFARLPYLEMLVRKLLVDWTAVQGDPATGAGCFLATGKNVW